MWRFDQGRIEYFQFDEIRKIAKFAVANDLKTSKNKALSDATGLPFYPADDNYPPWRNYSRVFRTAMLVAVAGGVAQPTKIAQLLSEDSKITSDEYFHFIAQTFTDPAPSFREWQPNDAPRFPLLFTLKFLLARVVVGAPTCSYLEIVGAYKGSGFNGDEDQSAFVTLVKKLWTSDDQRQARESIQVLSQISYLSATSTTVTVSLGADDALDVFHGLEAVRGDQATDREAEIVRLSNLYESAVAGLELDYSGTVIDQTLESGFSEGNRVERTHVVLERNANVRKAFFQSNPSSCCDFCSRDTKDEYPWADRVLDIHHVLPLCSGTRSTKDGTNLGDLVAVCPTCHRAIHSFSAQWLKSEGRKDFVDASEARSIYEIAKKTRKDA